jgi:hypothetical protein
MKNARRQVPTTAKNVERMAAENVGGAMIGMFVFAVRQHDRCWRERPDDALQLEPDVDVAILGAANHLFRGRRPFAIRVRRLERAGRRQIGRREEAQPHIGEPEHRHVGTVDPEAPHGRDALVLADDGGLPVNGRVGLGRSAPTLFRMSPLVINTTRTAPPAARTR